MVCAFLIPAADAVLRGWEEGVGPIGLFGWDGMG